MKNILKYLRIAIWSVFSCALFIVSIVVLGAMIGGMVWAFKQGYNVWP